jgi:hypothetical protein
MTRKKAAAAMEKAFQKKTTQNGFHQKIIENLQKSSETALKGGGNLRKKK